MSEAIGWTTRFLKVLGEGECEFRPIFEASAQRNLTEGGVLLALLMQELVRPRRNHLLPFTVHSEIHDGLAVPTAVLSARTSLTVEEQG